MSAAHMRKTDYERIAVTIAMFADSSVVDNQKIADGHVVNLIEMLQQTFQNNDPRFQPIKFARMCGFGHEFGPQ